MPALLTQCPNCNTSFRVTEAQQEAAGGLVRCGSCLAVFSAVDNEIRIKPPVQEQALDDIDAFFESLDRENAESDALSIEQALASEDSPNPEIAFTMKEEVPASGQVESKPVNTPIEVSAEEQANVLPDDELIDELIDKLIDELPDELPDELSGEQDAQTKEPAEEPTAEQIAEEIWNEQVAEQQPAPVPIDFATADPDEIAAELLDLAMPETEAFDVDEFEDESQQHVELAEHVELVQRDELAGHEDAEPLAPAIETAPTEAVAAEAEQVEVVLFVHDENDTGTISLGDMQLDELDEEPEEEVEEETNEETDVEIEEEFEAEGFEEETQAERESEHVISAAAPQRTSAEAKVQVREFLSSLDDDEKPLGPVDDASLDELDEEPLTFTASKQRSFASSAILFSANLVLLAALGMQWLYWNRATLDEHPRFSFLAPYVCNVFTCPAPEPLPATNALSSQQLLVRTHPSFPDALELSFIFNNDATTPQPFPNLELAFSDINNQLLANRLFTPSEYLPAELQQFDAMPPQTSVQVVMELADPGEGAVNYSVYFHDR